MTAFFNFVYRYRLWVLGLLAALAAANVAWVAGTYLVYPGYLDHGEPSVALISWRILNGLPAYPPIDGPDLTSNIYGPIIYLAHVIGYLLAGPGIFGSKIAGVAAITAIPVIVFFTQRRHGLGWASAAVILAAGYILLGLPMSVWIRPDPYIAFLVAVAVWAMNASKDDRPEWGKSLLIGLVAGLAAGLKMHAGIYFIPVVLFHCWERGFKPFFLISAIGAFVLAAPFASELFSFANVMAWVSVAVAKKTEFLLAGKVLRYLLFFLAAVLFFIAAFRWSGHSLKKAETIYFGTFLMAISIVLVPAMKPGAGWYYYFPFLAISTDMIVRYATLVTRNRTVILMGVGVLAAALVVISVPIQKRYFRALHWEEASRVTAEINQIMAAYPGMKMQMGAGDSLVGYNQTRYKPLLAFAGHPYTLDVGLAIEASARDIPISKGVRARIKECHTQIWLIPADESPFALKGYYGNPVFDNSFKNDFHRQFEKRKSFTYFDIWVCRGLDIPGD